MCIQEMDGMWIEEFIRINLIPDLVPRNGWGSYYFKINPIQENTPKLP